MIMTRLPVFAAVLTTTALACSPKAVPPVESGALPASIVEPYLTIQSALFHDEVAGVQANAGAIATAASALGAPAMKIDTAALQLAAASDLADARTRFGVLSDAVVTYMNGLHLAAPEGVRTAYCPMTQKPWLQKSASIENPYYGSQMPTCGNFR